MTTMPTTIPERVPMPMSLGAAPAAAGGALTPGDIIAMLKRRIVTIIILSILFGAAAVGLFFLFYVKFPSYSADAYIECISPEPKRQEDSRERQIAEDAFLRFVKGQELLIKQPAVLGLVLQDPGVQQTAWYREVDQDRRTIELEKAISAGMVKDTPYVRVAMTTRSPQDPHRIVNTVVDKYLTYVKEQSVSPYREELNQVRRELEQIKKQIEAKDTEIRLFAATIDPGNIPDREGAIGGGVKRESLLEQQKAVADLELEVASLESMREMYTSPTGPAITKEDVQIIEQDPRVAQLDNQIFLLEQEMAILLAQFGPNHREFRDMKKRRDEAEKQLEAARSTRMAEYVGQKIEMIDTAYFSAKSKLDKALDRLQQTKVEQADLENKQLQLAALQNDRALLIEQKNRVDDYLRELERIVRESQAIRVRAAVSAQPPLERSFPKLFMLPAVILAAIAAAVGLSLGLELLDTSVKTTQDIVRHLSIPVLGSIPDIDDEEVEIAQVETAVRDAPHAMITEAFRTVRSNLQFSAPAERLRAILVTSPKPEDGRTTVAVNLASSLAIAGRRVLLVDANFRRPALHRLFPQAAGRGFTNILVGEASGSECVQHTDLANLDVLGSGPIPPNPAELLGSELCRQFVSAMSQAYDHVIFDSPPALLASDSAVLAALMDGTILVLRAKDNSRGVAQRATTLLQHMNAHLLGAVLNAAQARRGGYFREQLRTFYDYQSEDERNRPALPGDNGRGHRKAGKEEDADA